MNDLVHYAAGLLVAGLLGFRGKTRLGLALFAVAPDWDVLTTPLLPWLLDVLPLSHAGAHRLTIILGHGAASHTVWLVGAILGIGWLAGLRGRRLLAAGLALASHYPLDFVLTWSVWPLMPLTDRGVAWGVVTADDLVLTLLGGALVLAMGGPDLLRWWRARKGRPAPREPSWVAPVGAALLVLAFVVPALLQARVLAQHATQDDAVADPVTYATYVVVEPGEETMRLVLVDAFRGVLAEETVARETDLTGGAPGAREALDTLRRALVDAPAPSPLVRPVFTVKPGEKPGTLVVEAREAAHVIAAKHLGRHELGFDYRIDAQGRVEAVYATQGGRLARIPVEVLPPSVPVVR